jgi:predicted dehydrogenase/threonine dehydrogenase-like Zn-dependent dehydrogenase
LKQILQNLKNGETELTDIPCPSINGGQLLIRTSCSLISSGTERMLIDFGKASLIDKARQQPDKVGMFIDKIKTDGLIPALNAVRGKLDQPLPLGYCNVGEVLKVGDLINGYAVGDRVVSNGKHAEVVAVSGNLCAKIPNNVSDEVAAFTVVGAIALQGIRLVQPSLGEVVVVIGLGLVGQIAVQLLRANGCRVLGVDFDENRLKLARSFGAEVHQLEIAADPVRTANDFSRGRGVDAVVITASTKSSDPIHQAASMCRKRGRIVLIGVSGMELSRDDFFEKELTFQVSASYGPGRYDPNYEERGQDYPIGFVRWTAQRNFEAVLDMMSEGRIDVAPLISHKFSLEYVLEAYKIVASETPSIGVLFNYHSRKQKSDLELQQSTVFIDKHKSKMDRGLSPKLAFIGSGNYANQTLIPAFKKAGANLLSVASNSGISGIYSGRKYGFSETTTDTAQLFNRQDIDCLIISTRHNSHADFVLKALDSGKHIFVEKPLCLKMEELLNIKEKYSEIKIKGKSPPNLMVGFNRRFSPQIQKVKSLLLCVGAPKSFVYTINAGAIPKEHWVHDRVFGGGRVIGEVCHFIDLMRFLSGSKIVGWNALFMDDLTKDTISIQLKFSDGSVGTILYLANGSKKFPKERLEVFSGGGILQLDNFRKLSGYGWPGFRKFNLWRQDKGQNSCAKVFLESIQNNRASPIPLEELFEVSKISIEISEALK